MKNNTQFSIWGGVLAGILLGFFVAPLIISSFSPATSGWRMMRLGGDSVVLDKHFIEEMVPHHQGAIEMAEVALEYSDRPEIRSLAEDIIAAQTAEIKQMSSWYREWYGVELSEESSTMIGMGHGTAGHMRGMEGDIQELKTAADFDLEFIQQMIVHHEMAVMMARMLEAGSTREEMRTLANNIIASQTKEIEMMSEWYSAWK